MSAANTTQKAPEGLNVVRRDLRFDFSDCDLRTWHPEGLHVAHFFNALSIFFPEGEKFFIDSVRHYADRIRSPKLQREVKGFIGQEAMHSREHRHYNEALAEAGLPVERLEKMVKDHLTFVRRRGIHANELAATIALEHFTAIMADMLLSDERLLEGADKRMAEVWYWHAIEETEHKAVAYDVYSEAIGTGLGAYLLRSIVMLLTTVDFWARVFYYHVALVRADGALRDWRGWGRFLRFAFVSPGGLRKLARPWAQYFRRNFHPWQHDNFHYVRRWTEVYAAGAQPSA